MRRLVVLLAALFGILLFFLFEVLWAPNDFTGYRFVKVSKGELFPQVVDSLQNAGVIRSPFLFSLAGRFLGYTKRIQIGKYRFHSGMSNREILLDLRFGTTVEYVRVIVPEGLKAKTIASLFARDVGIDSVKFMNLVNDSSLARRLNVNTKSLEGFLMPRTYTFYWQTDEEEIIKEMVDQFSRVFNDSLKTRTRTLGLTINQVLTLASIVEGESAIDSERSLISGVYYNRLKKGMRLQADPTVQYIIGNGPRRLKKSDLRIGSPFNTYLHSGLPPGPVNNPGRSAILAALYPQKSKFLYFVANGEGGHRFSRTYTEHRRAVQKYIKMKGEAGGKKRS